MSLKGYEWLDDNGEVTMRFIFKFLTLYILKDVTQEEFENFKKFLKEHKEDVLEIKYNGHKII